MSSLIWFRNDLRVNDNPALHYFLSNAEQNNTPKYAIVFISKKQWQQHDWSDIKTDLYIRHIHLLKQQLLTLDITLDVIKVDDFSSQLEFIQDYCKTNNIQSLFLNRELEVNEIERDKRVAQFCRQHQIILNTYESDVIVAKGKVLNKSGDMFKVFTPFKKAWLEYVKQTGVEYLGKQEISGFEYEQNTHGLSSSWPLITEIEQHVIPAFLDQKLCEYQNNRDFPAIIGTSGLSPYLAIGAISPRYLMMLLLNKYPELLFETASQQFCWLNELIWRDFYRHLIFHQPRLCKHQCFNEKYQNTQWPNNPKLFEAWCNGKTGYPIVDAAMQQLNTTGWMHNRLRMIVASFLTKHLLIDWRWGEKYFMSKLIDGDLAANNGGWQWAASTGCDAQPYFRIFNPILQSQKFDPTGDFIRKYLPELCDVPNKEIHFPHQYLDKHSKHDYWPAIVDHKQARIMALAFYK